MIGILIRKIYLGEHIMICVDNNMLIFYLYYDNKTLITINTKYNQIYISDQEIISENKSLNKKLLNIHTFCKHMYKLELSFVKILIDSFYV